MTKHTITHVTDGSPHYRCSCGVRYRNPERAAVHVKNIEKAITESEGS